MNRAIKEIVFQQDNAACHTAHKVNEYFRNNQINKISWPSHSPDLNIIENVWGKMKLILNKEIIRSRKELFIMQRKYGMKIYLKNLY